MGTTDTQGRAGRAAGRRLRKGLAALLATACLSAGPALAQTGDGASAPVAIAIPAQDLNAALLDFARLTGVQLLYDTAVVSGRRSTAVDDTVTPSEGLARLLAGTGVTFRRTETGAIALSPAPAQAHPVR